MSLLGEPSALDRSVCLVDRSQLLVGVPGHGDLEARVTGGQAAVEPFDLLVGQVLLPATEQTAALVQRVVLVAPSAEGVLLDASANLGCTGGCQ